MKSVGRAICIVVAPMAIASDASGFQGGFDMGKGTRLHIVH
jgi:hypothetical protein